MGIGCRFGTDKTDDDRLDYSGNRGYSIPNGTVEIEDRTGGMSATQQVRQSPLIEHTFGIACGEHVAGPLLAAPLGRIEVTAPRKFRGGESLGYDHRGAAVRAVPSRRTFAGL